MSILIIVIVAILLFVGYYKNRNNKMEALTIQDIDDISLKKLANPEPAEFKSQELFIDYEPDEKLRNPQSFENKKDTSFEDIEKYQQKFFGFRENINKDKNNNAPDAVACFEKIEEMDLAGKSVGEVYDILVKGGV